MQSYLAAGVCAPCHLLSSVKFMFELVLKVSVTYLQIKGSSWLVLFVVESVVCVGSNFLSFRLHNWVSESQSLVSAKFAFFLSGKRLVRPVSVRLVDWAWHPFLLFLNDVEHRDVFRFRRAEVANSSWQTVLRDDKRLNPKHRRTFDASTFMQTEVVQVVEGRLVKRRFNGWLFTALSWPKASVSRHSSLRPRSNDNRFNFHLI